VLDPDSLPIHTDILFCRSHGNEKLCDGFVCSEGAECQSGCCATFGTLKQDFCQPLLDGVCPAEGFTYGPNGDIHKPAEATVPESEEKSTADTQDEKVSSAAPEKLSSDTTGTKPPIDQKKESAFWYGVVVGSAVFISIIALLSMLYCCCCKKNGRSVAANDSSQY